MKTKLVTFLYFGIHGFPFYGYGGIARWYRFVFSLIQISNTGLPIVCYCGKDTHDKLETLLADHQVTNVKLKIKELKDYRYISEMIEIKEKHPDKFQYYFELGWAKIEAMQVEQEVGLDYLYWIDCGLSHLGIFPDRYNSNRNKVTNKNCNQYRFTYDGIFTKELFNNINNWLDKQLIDLRNTQLYYNTVELNIITDRSYSYKSLSVGGIIGGHTSKLPHFFDKFDQVAQLSLKKEFLLDHEAMMSSIVYDEPENYRSYIFNTWYHEDSYKTMPSVTYQYLKDKQSFYSFFEEIKDPTEISNNQTKTIQSTTQMREELVNPEKKVSNTNKVKNEKHQLNNSDYRPTIVTGLWDIQRGTLSEGWSRSFDHYLVKFEEFLDIPYNLIIFGEEGLREIVFAKRSKENTQFIVRPQEWFKSEIHAKTQRIRKKEEWKSQATWLKESPQCCLEMYNPLVMSKPFLLHDAKIMDKFNSTHLFWLDAGISNTVHIGYFTHDKVLDKLSDIDQISFIAFPYDANNEIHGFEYQELCKIAGSKVNKVCRGGFFGGAIEAIPAFNSNYYSLLTSTLDQGYMGTEESLFSIMIYKYPQHYDYFLIEPNGLIGKFFEDLKNNKHEKLSELKELKKSNPLKINNTALYVITFNSPNQVQLLINSMLDYDKDFVEKPQWFLLNNSTDLSTTAEYEKICETYDIVHIQKDNLGICGGRQFIAEHAEENEFDYYFFFEDDMFFYSNKGDVCQNGFVRYAEGLYKKTLEIAHSNHFDFLKLSFTEFFGDNKTQWAWYNVPQEFRAQYWPQYQHLPTHGLALDAPKTIFNKIDSHKGIAYADGEIYYCNWPQLVSRVGNTKMFLTKKWSRPFEQTWMSYIFQETIKANIHPGILLLSPTEHNRIDHYDKELRVESKLIEI